MINYLTMIGQKIVKIILVVLMGVILGESLLVTSQSSLAMAQRTEKGSIEATSLSQEKVTLFLFYGQGCLGCAKIRNKLATLQKKYPRLQVREFEIYFNQDNRNLFFRLAAAYQTTVTGKSVPVIFIDRSVILTEKREGYKILENEIFRCLREGSISPEEVLKESEEPRRNKKTELQEKERKTKERK